MFRASLRPSSGGQTAFSMPMVFCPVVNVVMLESRLASCVHCVETLKFIYTLKSYFHNINFHIILSTLFRYSKWFLPLRFSV